MSIWRERGSKARQTRSVLIAHFKKRRFCDNIKFMKSRLPVLNKQTSRVSLALVWSVFFVLLQSFSAGHATEYGDKAHYHNGEACLIQAVADRDDEPGTLPELLAFEAYPSSLKGPRPTVARLAPAEIRAGFLSRAPPHTR